MFPSDLSDSLLQQLSAAAKILQQGGVVAFPTESSYGLAANIYDDNALRRVYQLKGREEGKPFLVLIDNIKELERLVTEVPLEYKILMEQFWPGALTLVFSCRSEISPVLTCGGSTIAIRYSSHPVANALVAAFGKPLTATSANRAGEPPCTTAREVYAAFGDDIDMVIDGGRANAAPSTIVRLKEEGRKLEVLREGQLPAALFL